MILSPLIASISSFTTTVEPFISMVTTGVSPSSEAAESSASTSLITLSQPFISESPGITGVPMPPEVPEPLCTVRVPFTNVTSL